MKRRASDGGNAPSPKAYKFGGSSDQQRRVEFAHTVKALNSQFASWVQEQLREHGGDLWISGAEDYARHARDLLQDFADVISRRNEDSGATAQGPVPTSESPPARTGLQPSNGHAPSLFFGQPAAEAKPPTPSSFGLGSAPGTTGAGAFPALKPIATGKAGSDAPISAAAAPSTSAAPQALPFSAGSWFTAPTASASSSAPAPSLWSLPPATGGAVSATAAPLPAISAFTWGASSQPATAATGFAAITPAANGAPPAAATDPATNGADGQADDDAPAEPFKSEVVLDDGEVEMLFKGRCKLFSQSSEDKVWKERGVGMLTLRRPRGDGGKPYIVFTTESGRVLLNASLYKGMTIREQAGKPHMVMMVLPVPASEDGGDAANPRQLTLFRLPNPQRGQEFQDILKANVPTQ